MSNVAGALNFTLGLQANQFLNTANISTKAILGLTGAGHALNAAFSKMGDAIEKGGKLKDLAAGANISVSSLYKLQQGFEDVGASADAVPSIINRLRRTLASGEADSLLGQMGFDPKALGRMDPAKQFEAIAAAMAKLDDTSRSGAASKIFGREGAMIMQQIANSGGDFSSAMQRSAKDAAIWEKNAGVFDTIGDTAREIQGHMSTAWAGFTAGLAPALKQLGDWFNGFDLGAFGVRMGNEIALVFESIRLDKFGDYFALTLKSGVHEASNYMLSKIIDWGAAFTAAMNGDGGKGPGFWSKAGNTVAGVATGGLGLWNQVGANIGIPGAEEMANKRIEQAYGFFSKADMNDGILMKISDAFVSGVKGEENPFKQVLEAMRADLQASADGRIKPSENRPRGGDGINLDFGAAKMTTTSFTDIEKMGGVLNGLSRGFGGDESKSIDRNTRKTAEILNLHTKILGDIAPALKLIGVNI